MQHAPHCTICGLYDIRGLWFEQKKKTWLVSIRTTRPHTHIPFFIVFMRLPCMSTLLLIKSRLWYITYILSWSLESPKLTMTTTRKVHVNTKSSKHSQICLRVIILFCEQISASYFCTYFFFFSCRQNFPQIIATTTLGTEDNITKKKKKKLYHSSSTLSHSFMKALKSYSRKRMFFFLLRCKKKMFCYLHKSFFPFWAVTRVSC